MKILKLIATTFFLITISYSYSQTISGSVKFQSDRTNYSWIFIELDGVKTECDSLGEFELNNIKGNDTLVVFPFPIFIKVKIYNFSNNIDSIHFSSIPLFNNVRDVIPIINFRSKEASRKYFKQFEREKELEREQLIRRIRNYKYEWNGKEYNLEVVESEESLTILINMNQ